ncbi:MAG: MFS transporter [Promethearchaeia archaeon]
MSNINKNSGTIKVRTFSTKEKLYWGIASFGTSLISGIYATLLPIFYTDYLGLVESAHYIYIVSFVYAIWNALNDPLFGIISDRAKLKKGRRIPFMRYSAPFLGLFFILVWFAPKQPDIAIFWWMLITTFLYDTAFTIVGLMYSALLPEITESEQERNGLQVFASFFSLIGMILGFVIPELFRQQADLLPLQMAMIGVGILGTFCVMFTTYKFDERPEFTKVDEPLGFKAALKETFKSKSFNILVAANFMSILIQALLLGSIFYLADYIVKVSSIILLIFIILPLLFGIWLTPYFIEKFGVVRSDQILLLIGATGLLFLTFLPADLIYISLILAGFGLVGPLVYTNVLFAQVADEDELKTGVRREAMFFGINALITKPAQSIALVIPVILLDATGFIPRSLTGGVARPDLQPDAALLAIRIFIGLIPAICLYLEALILQFYPLKGEYWKEVQQKVLELHEKKHEKLKELENKK